MPLQLAVTAPREIGFIEYTERAPTANEVLVETTVSGIKHGTEINLYRGTNPFADQVWDPVLRVFRPPEEGESVTPFFPHTLGSWAAGIVKTVGSEVTTFKPGDRVHGEWKHQQTAVKAEAALYPIPSGVDAETMVFSDPARFALAAIHDAQIKLGDRVAVFGMGAIGLLAIQMARRNGATQVFAIDTIPARLELAQQLGADVVLNAAECDAGLEIKKATDKLGVDVAIEISGVYAGLQQAIRCVQREGRVVTTSYYGDQRGRVDLSREWHHNRITLISSMPVWGNTHRSAPLWNFARLERTAISLLAEQKIQVKPLISACIPFERAAEAYHLLDTAPSANVKILLTYTPL
ncbi:MAG TPA: zinc-binding dehydrogenase [Anaerolineae bacterium]|nr:zinc-binding dehydrogenase [Anaerolineae bacterium]